VGHNLVFLRKPQAKRLNFFYTAFMPVLLDQGSGAPKTFFLTPDPFIISETFLEYAFFNGYECYGIPDELRVDLASRVNIILEAFPETLLFFSIKSDESLEYWLKLIRRLHEKDSEKIRIGILYDKSISPERDLQIKRLFLYDIGITAGCIPLHVSNKENQTLLINVLAANQAAGKRKAIRMQGNANFRVNFLLDGKKISAEMSDLSTSHFSVQFDQYEPDWDIGTKVKSIQFSLGGLLITVDAILALKRVIHGKSLFVFVFGVPNDHHDLLRTKINQFIFQNYQAQTLAVLRKRFQDSMAQQPRNTPS
jgi:hypothetical protein